FDIGRDRLGACLQGASALDHAPGIVKDHPSGIVEHRDLAAAVKKRRSQRSLERLHGLTDCRLNAAKTPGRSGKAAGLRNRYQDTHLIESEGIEHRLSPELMDIHIIWPLPKILKGPISSATATGSAGFKWAVRFSRKRD